MKNKLSVKIQFILLILLCCDFFVGCNNQQKLLTGFWENDSKILHFSENQFYIYNLNSTEVLAFSGTYDFAENPSYAIKMSYKNYLDKDKNWQSLKDTQLENYTEINLFRISDQTLELKIIGNDQFFLYDRLDEKNVDSKLKQFK
ncbi:MAG: hypothetical protein MJ188_03440 [Treponema sp.]|nr:hypothetical protein [Treponema sp.]